MNPEELELISNWEEVGGLSSRAWLVIGWYALNLCGQLIYWIMMEDKKDE